MLNILISTICFINRNKPGAEIYAVFAARLIEDVLQKTSFDVMVTTNEVDLFAKYKNNTRVILREDVLNKHKLYVGRFNQMLKFLSIKNIDKKYDWVMYLDCDAGINKIWDPQEISNKIMHHKNLGYDMIATRTNAILKDELKSYEETGKNIFHEKFSFYNVTTANGPFEWFDARLPSEHIFIVENSDKLPLMCDQFEYFCTRFESQPSVGYYVAVDMEAFEIGVSATIAGYKMNEIGNDQYDLFGTLCNLNNNMVY